ncbi:uncharacterized protein L969DRAFT_88626, partial [Mixia osmundae IAM 14324]|uniref:uncharacterized protein n=1 Tax=Mixia osmundae (strain CBS 9802 / IAM 14324 / JCM 22182 / KY 12970) TaxID=764103 RepID=UPI0004A546DB
MSSALAFSLMMSALSFAGVSIMLPDVGTLRHPTADFRLTLCWSTAFHRPYYFPSPRTSLRHARGCAATARL